jgi:hypothetical protein
MTTGVTDLKEPPDAAPAQASTHARLRTAERHHDARPAHERTLHAGTGRSRTPPRACGAGPGNRVFCIWQPCARDSGNKTATSAHGMGSGGLAVDAMAIGCLGVERFREPFLKWHFVDPSFNYSSHGAPSDKRKRCLDWSSSTQTDSEVGGVMTASRARRFAPCLELVHS